MEFFWQELLAALPDQLAPLLGSVAISGAAEAVAWVGVDICSDDRLPAPPCASGSLSLYPDELAEWFVFLKCPVPQRLGLDTQEQPPVLSAPHS